MHPAPACRSGRAEVETYVHRSGRTGRAGRKGICVTLFSPKQRATLQQIGKETGNKFEWLGAPQPKAIMLTAAMTAAEDAAAVPDEVRKHFMPAAQALLDRCDGDPHTALAAALALATGHTVPPPIRSLLSNTDGYVTLSFQSQRSIDALGDVWSALRRELTEVRLRPPLPAPPSSTP